MTKLEIFNMIGFLDSESKTRMIKIIGPAQELQMCPTSSELTPGEDPKSIKEQVDAFFKDMSEKFLIVSQNINREFSIDINELVSLDVAIDFNLDKNDEREMYEFVLGFYRWCELRNLRSFLCTGYHLDI